MIAMRTVSIQGKEFPYKFGLGALLRYESLTQKPFEGITSTLSMSVIHYCCLSNGGDFPLSFSEFVKVCDDEGASLLKELSAVLTAEVERWNTHNTVDDGTEDASLSAKKK